MNAQCGYTSPGAMGADVCHLNLHKTFAMPHGGGGPGSGPIVVTKQLAPYLPGNDKSVGSMTASPIGNAGVLSIAYQYIKGLGKEGIKKATEVRIKYLKFHLIGGNFECELREI